MTHCALPVWQAMGIKIFNNHAQVLLAFCSCLERFLVLRKKRSIVLVVVVVCKNASKHQWHLEESALSVSAFSFHFVLRITNQLDLLLSYSWQAIGNRFSMQSIHLLFLWFLAHFFSTAENWSIRPTLNHLFHVHAVRPSILSKIEQNKTIYRWE